jgi:Family of unknown function (DUF6461)
VTDLPDLSRHEWLSDSAQTSLFEAGCVTLIAGALAKKVLTAFGADADERIPVAEVLDDAQAAVSVVEVDGGVIAVEFNGYQGSRPQVLQAAARPGKAASMFWNVNGHERFGCAQRGKVLTSYDLVLGDDRDQFPKMLLPLLELADNDQTDLTALGLAMAEQFTSITVTKDLIDAITVAYLLHPQVENDMYPESPENAGLRYVDEELVKLIASAPPETLRNLAEWAAVHSLSLRDLDDDDRARTVTSQFGRSTAAEFTAEAHGLLVQLERESDVLERKDRSRYGGEASPAMHLAWERAWAVRALRYATHPDAMSAALKAVDAALTCTRFNPQFLTEARQRLS